MLVCKYVECVALMQGPVGDRWNGRSVALYPVPLSLPTCL